MGNLLNSNWGVGQTQQRNSLLSFVDYDQNTGQPRFNFNPITNIRTVQPDGSTTSNLQTLNTTNRYITTEGSRYRIQLGLRYSFN